MARHFLRLKFALLRGQLREGWQQQIGVILGLLFGVPAALSIAVGLAVAGRAGGDVAGHVTILGLSVLTAGWVILPPVAFGIDSTLDPLKLALLPLTRLQLATGLLLAAAVGIGGLLTAVIVTGAVVGHAGGLVGTAIAIVAGVGQVLLCLLAGRACTTALSSRLRSRRGRDIGAMLVALVGVGIALLGQIPNLLLQLGPSTAEGAEAALERFAEAAGLTPLGWTSAAMVDAADGRYGLAVLRLAATAALSYGLVRWWLRSLRSTIEVPEVSGDRTGTDVDLVPAPLRLLPPGQVQALAAKDVRYLWRIPQQRIAWIVLPVLLVVMLLVFTLGLGLGGPQLTLVVALVPVVLGLNAFNSFGYDRDATWLYVAAGTRGLTAVAAKNLAALVFLAPMVVIAAIALAAITAGAAFVPAALLGAVGMFGLTAAVANATSVWMPFGMPETPTNMWNTSSGQGCATMLLQMVAFMALGVLLLPTTIAAWVLRDQPAGLALVGAATAAGGALVWWVSLLIADRHLTRRRPEWSAALRASR